VSDSELTIWLGLGNPGKRYQNTRHNIGWQCCDEIASALNISFESSKIGDIAKSSKLMLLKLPGYMNESGAYLKQAVTYFKWQLNQVLVIHDEIDFPVGSSKLKQDGGDGGHKGIRSIIDNFGTEVFWRLRLGIKGEPQEFKNKAHKDSFISNFVLSPFLEDEQTEVQKNFKKIVTLLDNIQENPRLAMNELNRV
jgi:peptidyl-tRNA hydrolase, PTH1 family